MDHVRQFKSSAAGRRFRQWWVIHLQSARLQYHKFRWEHNCWETYGIVGQGPMKRSQVSDAVFEENQRNNQIRASKILL